MHDLRVERLVRYLHSLAPDYFGAGLEPATEADLARLEAAASKPVVGYHRAFLLAMGNTKPGAVDPFLNGRVFNIDELIRAYPDLVGYGLTVAPDIMATSSSSEPLNPTASRSSDSSTSRPVNSPPTRSEVWRTTY